MGLLNINKHGGFNKMVSLESLEGLIEEARESKNKTGWNYRIGDKWMFADKKIARVLEGETVKVEFESSSMPDGRSANFVRTLTSLKPIVERVVVGQVPPSDHDILGCILQELREIKEVLKGK